MASNSIAPSGKAVDIYLDGIDWKVALFADDLTTQIVSADIGSVTVSASSVVALPLNLRAMGGDAANELRIFGAGVIKIRHIEPMNASFPVCGLTVADGEIIGAQIETIEAIGAGITRVSIAWGTKS